MQLLDISDNFLKISVPFRMMVAGPTLVGKSQFMLKAVRHRDQLFKGKFERRNEKMNFSSYSFSKPLGSALLASCRMSTIIEL